MNHHHRIQGLIASGTKNVVRRTFAAAAAATDKAKKGGGDDALKGSSLSKEIKSTTVVGAKDGTDPNISADSSDYPDWLWRLLLNRSALSELRRKNVETLPYDDHHLKRFVKLHTRAKINENNSIKAKN
ncbi:hypothetical protein Bca4012_086075 [Brassica carinata]